MFRQQKEKAKMPDFKFDPRFHCECDICSSVHIKGSYPDSTAAEMREKLERIENTCKEIYTGLRGFTRSDLRGVC